MRQTLVFTALAIATMFILSSNASAEPEYENPDLQLKFNWKEEGDMLSPQTKLPSDPEAQKTVQAQYTNTAGIIPNLIGNLLMWVLGLVIPQNLIFHYLLTHSIYGGKIQENGDDSHVWTISIEVNGAEISNDESDCQDDGTELTKRTHNLATNVDLVAGDTIGINLVYEGWEDIKIYYDNSTYDTGLNIVGKHNFFLLPAGADLL